MHMKEFNLINKRRLSILEIDIHTTVASFGSLICKNANFIF